MYNIQLYQSKRSGPYWI